MRQKRAAAEDHDAPHAGASQGAEIGEDGDSSQRDHEGLEVWQNGRDAHNTGRVLGNGQRSPKE
eukprot:8490835-Pyramimonas_sp.AAC.1